MGLYEATVMHVMHSEGGGVHYVEHMHPHALLTNYNKTLLHPITRLNASPLVGEDRQAL